MLLKVEYFQKKKKEEEEEGFTSILDKVFNHQKLKMLTAKQSP